MGRTLFVFFILAAAWGPAASSRAQQEAGSEAALVVEGRAERDGGAVVTATLSEATDGALTLRCRDGERILAETEGAAPSVSLVLAGEASAFNASCEAAAGDLRAARSVTVSAAEDEGGGDGWVFGLALGVTIAAAAAIVISMLVASANSPVNVGVPMVDGW